MIYVLSWERKAKILVIYEKGEIQRDIQKCWRKKRKNLEGMASTNENHYLKENKVKIYTEILERRM